MLQPSCLVTVPPCTCMLASFKRTTPPKVLLEVLSFCARLRLTVIGPMVMHWPSIIRYAVVLLAKTITPSPSLTSGFQGVLWLVLDLVSQAWTSGCANVAKHTAVTVVSERGQSPWKTWKTPLQEKLVS